MRSYVLVVDTFHEHQFSVGPFGMGLILKGPTQLLNCDVPLKVVIVRWAVGWEGGGQQLSQQFQQHFSKDQSFYSHLNTDLKYIC